MIAQAPDLINTATKMWDPQWGFAAAVALIMIVLVYHILTKTIAAFREVSDAHGTTVSRLATEHKETVEHLASEHKQERKENREETSEERKEFRHTIDDFGTAINGLSNAIRDSGNKDS